MTPGSHRGEQQQQGDNRGSDFIWHHISIRIALPHNKATEFPLQIQSQRA
jgi:hypothetical protein